MEYVRFSVWTQLPFSIILFHLKFTHQQKSKDEKRQKMMFYGQIVI